MRTAALSVNAAERLRGQRVPEGSASGAALRPRQIPRRPGQLAAVGPSASPELEQVEGDQHSGEVTTLNGGATPETVVGALASPRSPASRCCAGPERSGASSIADPLGHQPALVLEAPQRPTLDIALIEADLHTPAARAQQGHVSFEAQRLASSGPSALPVHTRPLDPEAEEAIPSALTIIRKSKLALEMAELALLQNQQSPSGASEAMAAAAAAAASAAVASSHRELLLGRYTERSDFTERSDGTAYATARSNQPAPPPPPPQLDALGSTAQAGARRRRPVRTGPYTGARVPLAARLAAYRAGSQGQTRTSRGLCERVRGTCALAGQALTALASSLQLRQRMWRRPIRFIEGNFGSGIGDFFAQWRDVVYLDAWASLVWLGVVILPFLVAQSELQASDAASALDARLRNWTLLALSLVDGGNQTALAMGAAPLALAAGQGGLAASSSNGSSLAAAPDSSRLNLTLGLSGLMSGGAPRSEHPFAFLFYGGYTQWVGSYALGEAYTSSTLATYAILLLSTLGFMVANARDAHETAGRGGPTAHSLFTCHLFAAVDFNCTEAEAVRVGILTACGDMREALLSDSLGEEEAALSECERLWRAARHALGALLSLVLVCLYLAAVVFLCAEDPALAEVAFATPVFLALVKLGTPLAVRAVIKLEGYRDPGEIVKQMCLRVYALKMANLAIALYGVHTTLHLSACPNTTSGQFMLRLLLTDLLVSLGSSWAVALLTYHVLSPGQLQDYDISGPVIDLCYRHAMALVGVFTCPVILPVFVVGETLLFYSTVALLRAYFKRPARPFDLAQGKNFLHGLSALTIVLSLAGTLWLMFQPMPEGSCGPHNSHVPVSISLDALHARRSAVIDNVLLVCCSPFTYVVLAALFAARLLFRSATVERLAEEIAGLQEDLSAEKALVRTLIVDNKIELH